MSYDPANPSEGKNAFSLQPHIEELLKSALPEFLWRRRTTNRRSASMTEPSPRCRRASKRIAARAIFIRRPATGPKPKANTGKPSRSILKARWRTTRWACSKYRRRSNLKSPATGLIQTEFTSTRPFIIMKRLRSPARISPPLIIICVFHISISAITKRRSTTSN